MCPSIISRKTIWVVCLSLAGFVMCPPLFSQTANGRISGVVRDQTGGAVAGAMVTVTDVARDLAIDAVLVPGSQTQTVTITEDVPLVNTTSATLGGTLSNATIVDLPLNG